MKLFVALAHADENKLPFLSRVLQTLATLTKEVHVAVITNIVDHKKLDKIRSCAPRQSRYFKLEIYNEGCNELPSPWLLTWVHKKIMLEKFKDATFTHFMCIEDDMEVTPVNFEYWLRDRERLRQFNLYPSFLRTEWNHTHRKWTMTESVKGDCFSVSKSPKILISNESYGWINLGRSYQGMFLYDRPLMEEHIKSISFDLFRFVPDWKVRILRKDWPLGITEAAVIGLTHINVPAGCFSRNFTPFYPKYLTIDPCCLVHHLPDKYTNIPDSVSGKVFLEDILCE